MNRISDREPQKQNGFVLLWKIRNYGMCAVPRNGCIASPKFLISNLHCSEWQIKLYPWNKNNKNCLGISIEKISGGDNISVDISMKFFTRQVDHLLVKGTFIDYQYSCFESLTHEDIIKEDSIFILDDTLTLSCHFSNENMKSESLVMCSALTQVEIERRVFQCSFDRINENAVGNSMSRVVPSTSGDTPVLNMALNFAALGNRARTFIYIYFAGKQNIYTVRTKISVVCTDGSLSYTKKNHKLFVLEGQSWYFWHKFNLNQLLKDKELYLQNDILTLQCELFISSSNAIRSLLEECKLIPNYSENKDKEFGPRLPHNIPSGSSIPAEFEGLMSLKEDLRTLLIERKMCDVVVRVEEREFHVHKAILCARSPVFNSMLESDMKVKKSGVVHIDDIDAETIDIFLNYLYVGSLKNLEWDTALTLYSTADKYQVKTLKKECRFFLSSKISEKNVCDILILADMHQDTNLKLSAEEVFCKHSKNVLLSREWITLIQEHPNLAVEVLQVMAAKM